MKTYHKYIAIVVIVLLGALALYEALPRDLHFGSIQITVPKASQAGQTLVSNSDGTWSPSTTFCNFAGRNVVSCYTGADIGAQILAAQAALTSAGGVLYMPCDTETQTTQIVLTKPIVLQGCSVTSSVMTWTGQATSTILREGQTGDVSMGIRDMTIQGTSTSDIAPLIEYGGGSGSFAYGLTENIHVTLGGDGIYIGANSYILDFHHIISDFNVRDFAIGNGSNQNEQITVDGASIFGDGRNSVGNPYDHCVDLLPNPSNGAPSINFTDVSLDKCQLYVGAETNFHGSQLHLEVLGNGIAYYPVIINGDANTSTTFVGSRFLMGNNSSHSPSCYIQNNANLSVTDSEVSEYGGYTPTAFVCNSASVARSYVNVINIANSGYGTLESNSDSGTNVKYLIGGKAGFGTLSTVAAINASSTFPQLFISNGGSTGGNVYGGITNSGNGAGGNRFILSSTTSTTAGQFTWDLSNGFFGFGTTTPGVRADIAGLVRVYQEATTSCTSLIEGSMFYNHSNHHFWGCDGTSWNKLDN